jgi:excinuclease ABC subunit C
VPSKVKTGRARLTPRGPLIESLLEKAKSLPKKAGCYLMKNKDDQVLYVGKAKSLKSRVSSYFQQGSKSSKTEILVSHIRDFDFLLTETEAEAFVLENNLIKKHSPKYNIMLRDDKSYPYVVIKKKEPFPRLHYMRKVSRSSEVEVFGPFVHGSNISEVLRILTKSFQLRDCSLREFNSRKQPCLLYQIKQCSAPCVGKISDENYQRDLNYALGVFRGEAEGTLKILEEKMHGYAQAEEFELAIIFRENIQVLKDFLSYSKQENAEIYGKDKDVDILAYHVGEIEVDISLYLIRNCLLLGHKSFHFSLVDCDEGVEENILNFIYQYYSGTHDSYPKKLITLLETSKRKLLTETLKEYFPLKVTLPGKDFKKLMKLTQDQVNENQRVRIANEESVYIGLNKLKDLLKLRERPRVLECYDVAIFQGSSPTAAQIVFEEGRPNKNKYRHYHLQEREEGNNDFAMMKEVLSRRVKKGDLPDVFIVDGGKGQVSVFQSVLKEFDLDIPVVGLAKSKVLGGKNSFKQEDIRRSEERLIIPGRLNPYFLNKNKSLFRIMTQMRDEAHRFSRRLHHKAEKKRVLSSWVDQIEGVGGKIRKQILEGLTHTEEELRGMSDEELVKALGVDKKILLKIRKALD